MSREISIWLVLLAVVVCEGKGLENPPTPLLYAPRTTSARSPWRVDTNHVQVPATVTNLWGARYRGLAVDAFRLFENGAEQHVAYLTSEDAPVSLGIVFDASGSMDGKLDQARAAVAELFATAVPGDEYFVVQVGEVPTLICDFTRDTDLIERSLASIHATGSTALVDSVYFATQHLRHAVNSRHMLFILSDGGENVSRYTKGELISLIREADLCIYSIALSRWLRLSLDDVSLLKRLAEETGGQFWQVAHIGLLQQTIWKLSLTMRSLYMLYYSSTRSTNDGLYRKIQVRLRPCVGSHLRLRVSNRRGYYAPDR